MLDETTRAREAAEAAPPRPDGSQRTGSRRTWGGKHWGAVATIGAAWLVLAVVVAQLNGNLRTVRSQISDARSAAATTDDRLAAVASAEASLSSELGGLFDPQTIVREIGR